MVVSGGEKNVVGMIAVVAAMFECDCLEWPAGGEGGKVGFVYVHKSESKVPKSYFR